MNAVGHQVDAGRYGLAYRLMQVAILPLSSLASATHVSFLEGGRKGRNQTSRAVRLSLMGLPYALTAALALALVAPYVPRLLTPDFEASSQILRMLTPVVVLRGLGMFPMNGIMGLGRNDVRTKILIANSLFALAMYAALIPRYSWKGALGATLASEVSLFASGWIALRILEREACAQGALEASVERVSKAEGDRSRDG
jgi:O-antigen/teichoic acid export membrane protein